MDDAQYFECEGGGGGGGGTEEKHGIPETVRSRMQSAWNNVRYGKNIFQTKATFTDKSPVWLLGIPYSNQRRGGGEQQQSDEKSEIQAFRTDFESRIWFTYRKDLEVFPGTHLTSDAGWGCMLRSAQMLMAQALTLHTSGRQWRWEGGKEGSTTSPEKITFDNYHRRIIKLFSETEDLNLAPFSIHNLVRLSCGLGREAGNWFGPATAAFLLQMAWLNNVQLAEESADSVLKNLSVYVAQDCTVYKEDVINICSGNQGKSEIEGFAVVETPTEVDTFCQEDFQLSDDLQYSFSEEVTADYTTTSFQHHEKTRQSLTRKTRENNAAICKTLAAWKSVVILIPIRVGGEKFNPVYAGCLKNLLTLPCCLGWIGGKPGHSLYFIGYQEDYLLHLDPHRIQSKVETRDPGFSLKSFHSGAPRKISMAKMDPSCCLGFYIRSRDEFELWCAEIEAYVTPTLDTSSPSRGRSTVEYPMFTVQQKSSGLAYQKTENMQNYQEKTQKGLESNTADDWVNMEAVVEANSNTASEQQSEEFVFL